MLRNCRKMNPKNELYLIAEDYTVSHKKFDLLYKPIVLFQKSSLS
jgi:hypothetical protein